MNQTRQRPLPPPPAARAGQERGGDNDYSSGMRCTTAKHIEAVELTTSLPSEEEEVVLRFFLKFFSLFWLAVS